MSTETLPIKKEAAIKAYNEADSNGKALLVNLFGANSLNVDPKSWVKNFSDICKAAGVNESDYAIQTGWTDDEKAAMQVKRIRLICKVLNGDWIPNAADTSQYKYYPYFKVHPDTTVPSGFRLSSYVYVFDLSIAYLGSRLFYRDGLTAKFAGETFIDEYKNLFTF